MLPFCDALAVKQSGLEVAPGILFHVAPALVLTCHCNVGAGEPLAAAVKQTCDPAHTVLSFGLSVTTGGVFTVRVPAFEFAVPQSFVKTALYLLPF